MKRALSGFSLLALLAAGGCNQHHPEPSHAVEPATLSSFDLVKPGEKPVAPGLIKFEQSELDSVLKIYGEISGRSIIRAGNLPEVKITFFNQTPLSKVEILQALDTVLAAQGIATVLLGTQYVKVVPANQACLEPGPIVELPAEQLPDSSSFLIYIVKLRNVTAAQAAPALQPFARLPNSIIPISSGGANSSPAKSALPQLPATLFGGKGNNILILRDYSSNVRRMLQVLDKLDPR